ncbi:glycosyl transferase, group 1 [Candidatus Koribacter versatilis Ellin345]|uniref:Glycosyl transferase, group 1 n=1 Tax=Koribacter versatilis (strain Ellin345) TaxID=204669 RepID=Q1IN22_KORVE|nr:glycosyl transferase, group 1 [Candidatus Koribacter versatilis Ellin345]
MAMSERRHCGRPAVRILYLITRAQRGGAQAHLLKLAGASSRNNEVLVAVGEEGVLCSDLRRRGISCIVLEHMKHAPHPWHDALGVRELIRLIRNFQPDVVHAHSGKAGLLGRVAAAICGVPAVYTAHGYAFANQAPWLQKTIALPAERLAARTGGLTIAVSRSECRLAASSGIGGVNQTVVVHNGCEPSAYPAEPGVSPPVVVMVARFARPKRQDRLIRAFSQIAGQSQLWLVGDGPGLRSARELAQGSGVRDRIIFWGDRDDVSALLGRAQVAALISDHEGFGLALIEAMSAGLPVIASDVGGMREIVVPGETGLLVPANDETNLEVALRRLIANPQERQRMGSAGLVRFREKFTLDRMLTDTFRVYDLALGAATREEVNACVHCRYPAACGAGAVVSGD